MLRRFTALLLFGWLMLAGTAWAEPPVSVSHILTGYTLETDSVVLNCSLTVRNIGTTSISNVALSLVPVAIASTTPVIVKVGSLAPQAEIQVPVTFTTPLLLSESEFRGQTLFWAGTCADSTGSLMEFPANSVEGGAR